MVVKVHVFQVVGVHEDLIPYNPNRTKLILTSNISDLHLTLGIFMFQGAWTGGWQGQFPILGIEQGAAEFSTGQYLTLEGQMAHGAWGFVIAGPARVLYWIEETKEEIKEPEETKEAPEMDEPKVKAPEYKRRWGPFRW